VIETIACPDGAVKGVPMVAVAPNGEILLTLDEIVP
jgi:hypothetical protein